MERYNHSNILFSCFESNIHPAEYSELMCLRFWIPHLNIYKWHFWALHIGRAGTLFSQKWGNFDVLNILHNNPRFGYCPKCHFRKQNKTQNEESFCWRVSINLQFKPSLRLHSQFRKYRLIIYLLNYLRPKLSLNWRLRRVIWFNFWFLF